MPRGTASFTEEQRAQFVSIVKRSTIEEENIQRQLPVLEDGIQTVEVVGETEIPVFETVNLRAKIMRLPVDAEEAAEKLGLEKSVVNSLRLSMASTLHKGFLDRKKIADDEEFHLLFKSQNIPGTRGKNKEALESAGIFDLL